MSIAESLRFADRFDGITGSAIRDIFKLLGQPGMISFAGGNPAASALENDVIAEIARDVLLRDGKRILQYGGSEGDAVLREESAKFLAQAGVHVAPDSLLPVSGTTQTIDLLCKALINPGDAILVENPSFLGALQTMRLYQANLIPLEMDDGGMVLGALEDAMRKHRPKMLYTIPTFQNPTGITLALDRREAVAKLAAKYGVLVLEDDPYRDLRYTGKPLPTIKSFDTEDAVIYLGSFSKLIAPGLRVGVVTATPTLMRKLVIGKQSTDLHTDNLSQAIVAEYLKRGLLPAHAESICASYRAQLTRMLAGFEGFPEGTTHTAPEGGLFLWGTLPENMDARKLLEIAIRRKVAFVPGTHFYCTGGHDHTFRLNFSNSSLEKIDEGMGALREAMRDYTSM